MPKTPIPPEVRFAANVRVRTDGCMEWTGSTNNKGYGTFSANGRSVMAHRWAYESAHGEIPKGLRLDHLCRNRWCVNPDHLEPVSQRENLLRGETIPAMNARKTHCPSGHLYSPENTYRSPNTGDRSCRTCTYINNRTRRLMKAA